MTRRLVIAAVVLLCAVGIAVAGTLGQTGDDIEEPITSGAAVERLIPRRGSEMLAQEAVGIDLAPGFTAVLILNGVEIPEDQLNRRTGVDEVLYRPSEDGAAVEYEAGENCLVALVWSRDQSRAEAQPVSWCFNVT